MPLFKNTASQKLAVYAYDTSADDPKTGDAANITAQISKDGGATAATNDVNPTELDATDAKGIYIFDLTQAETNADLIIVSAVSATSNIKIEPVIIYTSEAMRGTDSAALAATLETKVPQNLNLTAYGNIGIDWANVENPTTALDLSGTDIQLVDTCTTNTDMISAATVNAQVVDALNTDTYAEPAQGAPGATISLAQKIGYLYKAWRNKKTQTATTYSLFNDDAATVDHKSTVSDNGTTATIGEIATGP